METNNLIRRKGRFQISEHLIKENPEDALKALSECLVIHCELKYETMTFDYVAISRHFEEVPDYQISPTYEALLERINTGTDEEPIWETRLQGFQKVTNPPAQF